MYTGTLMSLSPLCNSRNQCAGDALTTCFLGGEEVLKIANIRPRRIGMDEEVCDANKSAIQPRPEGVQTRILLKLTPRSFVHLGRHNPLVKVDICAEQVFPDSPVGGL
ncbi:hypothetical protein KSD_97060 [Ktedonobacter sp. SOSP1-85]|nr:hypothetical protein [Ktedonobacter sp. SOSP1-85]GHO81935.1 hypothetical protein KSD_97060 [Ktedonobacter sp. SOSP1-85]